MILKSDLVVFQGGGTVFQILSRLIKIFNPWWNRWGWHTAIVWRQGIGGWFLLEATGQGVQEKFYTNIYLREHTLIYHWLPKCPAQRKMDKFFEEHILKHYDVTSYFWTTLQYLIRHYFNHRIPRLLDDRYTCWELIFEFCEKMGREIGSRYDCPMITEMVKAFLVNHIPPCSIDSL